MVESCHFVNLLIKVGAWRKVIERLYPLWLINSLGGKG